jgi:hypothetical protein
VIVRLPDGLQVAVPTWMLNPAECSALTDEAAPKISIEALLELRALIDSQPESRGQVSTPRSSSQGGTDEQEPTEQITPADTASRTR